MILKSPIRHAEVYRIGVPDTNSRCARHLVDDRGAPSFHHDQPIADKTAVLQFTVPISRLRHDHLGLDFERPRAEEVAGGVPNMGVWNGG